MADKRKYSDRAEYLKEAVSKRRRTLREQAIMYKGGKCVICGYCKCIESLDFHHINEKEFGLSTKGITRSWEKVKKELNKCVLLCANCHREVHAGITQLSAEMQNE